MAAPVTAWLFSRDGVAKSPCKCGSLPGIYTATKDIEHELSACMDELERAMLDNDAESAKVLMKRTAAQLAERNRLCKLNK